MNMEKILVTLNAYIRRKYQTEYKRIMSDGEHYMLFEIYPSSGDINILSQEKVGLDEESLKTWIVSHLYRP